MVKGFIKATLLSFLELKSRDIILEQFRPTTLVKIGLKCYIVDESVALFMSAEPLI